MRVGGVSGHKYDVLIHMTTIMSRGSSPFDDWVRLEGSLGGMTTRVFNVTNLNELNGVEHPNP